MIVDVPNLSHRAMHSTGQLRHGDEVTGVIYGVLRECFALQDRFGAYSVVPTFDHPESRRRELYPAYKESRRLRKLTDDEDEMFRSMQAQIKRLRADIFPRLGYSNVLYQRGCEADDLIAACCHGLPDDDEAVIVTGDKDMLQLLTDNVRVYHPISQKLVTRRAFRKEWRLGPAKWAEIKAVAGCSTDDIPGVDKVAEKTAAKFFRKELPRTHKTYKAITDFVGTADHRRNLALVTLPLAGTEPVELKPDDIDIKVREEVLNELGVLRFL